MRIGFWGRCWGILPNANFYLGACYNRGMITEKVKRQGRSYRYAANGVKYTLSTQVNIWVHLVSAVAVLVLGWLLEFSWEQLLLVVLAVGLVVSAELMNTAIEELVNLLSPDHQAQAGVVKDIAAGAVLVAAIAAAIIGGALFGPALMGLLG